MHSKPHLVLIDQTIVVERSLDDAFAFVANHENYALWFPGVLSVVSKTSEPHGTVGKVYSETLRMPTGRIREIEIPVVESEAPHRFATEADFAPLQPRMAFELKGLGATQTEIRWLFSSRARSFLGRLLIRRLFAKSLAAAGCVAAGKLKTVLEHSSEDLTSSAGSRS